LVTDSLAQAKGLHPGKRNSLDALCDRYGVSNSHRTLHGALLDSELLAEVYLAMTRGQNSLTMEPEEVSTTQEADSLGTISFDSIIVIAASAEELDEHEVVVKSLDKEVRGTSLWRSFEQPPAEAAPG
jgi:DNA polymerase-3 subunit epsilon